MSKDGWLCGELNSKNGSGGYVGFKRFIAGSPDDAYLDGYGYVGNEVEESTKRLIERLDFEIAILKKNNEARATNESVGRLSKSEINEMVTKDLFEKRWKQICGT